jgi:hypothetical protein
MGENGQEVKCLLFSLVPSRAVTRRMLLSLGFLSIAGEFKQ